MKEINEVLYKEGDYYKLYSILEKELINVKIILHIEKSFLEPYEILIITQFIIRQKQRGCEIEINAMPEVKDYLNAIDISNFCIKNEDFPYTLQAVSSYTSMPIRRVEEESMNEYIQSTQNYFRSFCPGKDLAMLDLCLSELINNVYNHTHSPIGAYVFCQFDETTQEIKMAVSDLGIGIPHSVNVHLIKDGKEVMVERDCVQWAMKENMTTKSIPRNMGKGLDIVKSFMEKTECNWRLYSSNVLMNADHTGINYFENPIFYFKGTIIQLNIKIENLSEEEVIDELDWLSS